MSCRKKTFLNVQIKNSSPFLTTKQTNGRKYSTNFLFTFFMLDEFLFCTITQMIILFRKRNQIGWNLHFPIWRTHISTRFGGFTSENLEELKDFFITLKIQFFDFKKNMKICEEELSMNPRMWNINRIKSFWARTIEWNGHLRKNSFFLLRLS